MSKVYQFIKLYTDREMFIQKSIEWNVLKSYVTSLKVMLQKYQRLCRIWVIFSRKMYIFQNPHPSLTLSRTLVTMKYQKDKLIGHDCHYFHSLWYCSGRWRGLKLSFYSFKNMRLIKWGLYNKSLILIAL